MVSAFRAKIQPVVVIAGSAWQFFSGRLCKNVISAYVKSEDFSTSLLLEQNLEL